MPVKLAAMIKVLVSTFAPGIMLRKPLPLLASHANLPFMNHYPTFPFTRCCHLLAKFLTFRLNNTERCAHYQMPHSPGSSHSQKGIKGNIGLMSYSGILLILLTIVFCMTRMMPWAHSRSQSSDISFIVLTYWVSHKNVALTQQAMRLHELQQTIASFTIEHLWTSL